MWQEEQDEDALDDVPENYVLCALHQAKILRERWKYWSGTVPANVSVRLNRLESRLSINEANRQQRSISENNLELSKNQSINISSNASAIPIRRLSKIDSSEPFLSEIKDSTSIDKYISDRIEPKQNIIIQGPDIRHIRRKKRRNLFWCCH